MKCRVYSLVILLGLFTSCGQRSAYFPSKLEPIPVTLERVDKALLQVSTDSPLEDIRALYDSFPDFMPVFVEDILGVPSSDTAFLCQALPQFLQDTTYGFKLTNEREQELFGSVFDIEQSLGNAFARVLYLYPDWTLPTLYLFVSGFNASLVWVGEDLGIGADMYLGSDYAYYNRVVHHYQKQTMRKECIPADVVSAYLFRHIPYTAKQARLIDQMLYRGKIMYLLSLCFPNLPGYEVMGYTPDQWIWAKEHERDIWNLLMDQRALFKYDNLTLASYLNDGPFTAEISQDCPARIGTWIGWQIAAAFMHNHSTATLQDLMAEGDSQWILENSGYRP